MAPEIPENVRKQIEEGIAKAEEHIENAEAIVEVLRKAGVDTLEQSKQIQETKMRVARWRGAIGEG